ncbi:SpoIIE family protein phosphatase [Streptomyces sp. NPDC002911]
MGQLPSAVRAFVFIGRAPQEIMSATDHCSSASTPVIRQLLLRPARPRDRSRPGRSAGHPQPVLRHPGGRTEVLDLPGGVVLGVDLEASYPVTEPRLGDGGSPGPVHGRARGKGGYGHRRGNRASAGQPGHGGPCATRRDR